MISVIVPVYNAGQYLEECIKSLLQQTFSDFELLLIDDGSDDESGGVCDRLARTDSRIRVFHKANGGVSSARNMGLEQACREWVTFVDADDYVEPDFLDDLYRPVTEDSKIGLVHGGCVACCDGQMWIEQKYFHLVSEDPSVIFNRLRGLCVSKLFRLETIRANKLKFDPNMKIGEDMAFTLDYMLHIDRYCFVSTTDYCYRRHMASATKCNRKINYETSKAEFDHLYNSITGYIAGKQLDVSDSRFRLSQLAAQLFRILTLLYQIGLSRQERFGHLQNDFIRPQRLLLEYIDAGYVKNRLAYLYMKNHLVVFDFLLHTFYRLKGRK